MSRCLLAIHTISVCRSRSLARTWVLSGPGSNHIYNVYKYLHHLFPHDRDLKQSYDDANVARDENEKT